jgi:hypothetical protein
MRQIGRPERAIHELRGFWMIELGMQMRKLRMKGLRYLREDGQLDAVMFGHFDGWSCLSRLNTRTCFWKEGGYDM